MLTQATALFRRSARQVVPLLCGHLHIILLESLRCVPNEFPFLSPTPPSTPQPVRPFPTTGNNHNFIWSYHSTLTEQGFFINVGI